MAIKIGDRIPEFNLPATDGKVYTPETLKGENGTVIMFWCNHCPYVIPNQDRIITMQDEYRDKGVNFAAICANNAVSHPADSFENMKKRAEEKGYNFPYIRDEEQDVARTFGAERTPEIFLFDSKGTLTYHGRIDDSPDDLSQARSHDLKNAIDAVLAGGKPSPEKTGTQGCSIKWK